MARKVYSPATVAQREASAAAEIRLALAELRDAEASRARNPERYQTAGERFNRAAEAFLAVRGLPPSGL